MTDIKLVGVSGFWNSTQSTHCLLQDLCNSAGVSQSEEERPVSLGFCCFQACESVMCFEEFIVLIDKADLTKKGFTDRKALVYIHLTVLHFVLKLHRNFQQAYRNKRRILNQSDDRYCTSTRKRSRSQFQYFAQKTEYIFRTETMTKVTKSNYFSIIKKRVIIINK